MTIATFPRYKPEWAKNRGHHRYYGDFTFTSHAGYFVWVHQLLVGAGIDVQLIDPVDLVVKGHPQIDIQGKRIVVDIGETFDDYWDPGLTSELHGLFQLHWHEGSCQHWRGKSRPSASGTEGLVVEPIGPTSFYDWDLYEQMSKREECSAADRSSIIWKQLSTKYRRKLGQWNNVTRQLSGFPDVDTTRKPSEVFYQEMQDCLLMVHIPGSRPDILDKALMQGFGLGVCIVCPILRGELAYKKEFTPGIDYVECKRDMSDVGSKVKWVIDHKEEAREIGRSAMRKFREFCMPKVILQWMLECLR